MALLLSHVAVGQLNTAEQGGGGGAKCSCMRGVVFAQTPRF